MEEKAILYQETPEQFWGVSSFVEKKNNRTYIWGILTSENDIFKKHFMRQSYTVSNYFLYLFLTTLLKKQNIVRFLKKISSPRKWYLFKNSKRQLCCIKYLFFVVKKNIEPISEGYSLQKTISLRKNYETVLYCIKLLFCISF